MIMKKLPWLFISFFLFLNTVLSQNKRAREYGVEIGVLKTGMLNSITDVKGVKVGHRTLIKDSHIRTVLKN
jgi:D-aminopeptidase